MKGRRPKGKAPLVQAHIINEELAPPEQVEASPLLLKYWEIITSDSTARQFTQADAPTIALLCYWHGIAEQCAVNLNTDDGRVITRLEDNEGLDRVRHPDIMTMKQASAEIRSLSAELGISPLARARIGLMDAATQSTQADIQDKIQRIMAAQGRLPDADH